MNLKTCEPNPHIERVLSFISAKSAKDNSMVDLRLNCRNRTEFGMLLTFCDRAKGRELAESEAKNLRTLALELYEASVVEKVSGFFAFEPSIEDMEAIQTLLYMPEPALYYRDTGLADFHTKEMEFEFEFCADCEVNLEPNFQLVLPLEV